MTASISIIASHSSLDGESDRSHYIQINLQAGVTDYSNYLYVQLSRVLHVLYHDYFRIFEIFTKKSSIMIMLFKKRRCFINYENLHNNQVIHISNIPQRAISPKEKKESMTGQYSRINAFFILKEIL